MRYIITNTAKVVNLEMAIAEYQRQEVRSSGNTQKAKALDLAVLNEFLSDEYPTASLTDITRGSIEDFVEYRLALEAPSTVARRLATVKHFCRVMSEVFLDFKNPSRGITAPRIDRADPPRLSHEEKERLRAAASSAHRCDIALRNLLILELGLMQGLRCSEIAGLKLKNVQNNLLAKFRGKGTRYSTMVMHSKVQRLVEQYSSLRDAKLTDCFPLYRQLPERDKLSFPYLISLTGCDFDKPESFALNPKTVWRVVNEAGKKAGVAVWTHKLRHTAIKDFYRASGNDIYRTAKYARHSNVNTTMFYAESSVEEIGKTMEAMK